MNNQTIQTQLNINPAKLNAYSTGLLQGKSYNRLHNYLTKTLLPFEVSVPEWKLLGQVYEHDRMRLAELADYLSYDPPMVTKLVKQLERRDMVKRLPDETDERAKIIVITGKGKTLIEAIEPEVKMAMGIALQGVSRDEMLVYIKVLSTILNNL